MNAETVTVLTDNFKLHDQHCTAKTQTLTQTHKIITVKPNTVTAIASHNYYHYF